MTDLSHMNNSLESMYYTEVYVKTYKSGELIRYLFSSDKGTRNRLHI